MMRKLIDRRRREIVLRLQNFQQFPAIQNRTEVMHGRIALIYADSIASKLLLHVTKPPSRFIQRLIPADRLPLAIRFPYGMSKTIGIFVDIFQREGLWTDVTARKRIEFVTEDRLYPSVFVLYLNAADRFAQVAVSEMLHRESVESSESFESVESFESFGSVECAAASGAPKVRM